MLVDEKLELVKANDTILHKPCEKFNFLDPPFDIMEFYPKLVTKMRELRGMGLAANQVGVPYKIFAMESDPLYIVINPKVVEVSKQMIMLEEGCLSYPSLIVKVKRPLWIKVRFNYPNGTAHTYRFEGMTARVFLHEFDHVEYGHTFFDAANFLHKEKAKKEWNILQRKQR